MRLFEHQSIINRLPSAPLRGVSPIKALFKVPPLFISQSLWMLRFPQYPRFESLQTSIQIHWVHLSWIVLITKDRSAWILMARSLFLEMWCLMSFLSPLLNKPPLVIAPRLHLNSLYSLQTKYLLSPFNQQIHPATIPISHSSRSLFPYSNPIWLSLSSSFIILTTTNKLSCHADQSQVWNLQTQIHCLKRIQLSS